MEQLCFTLTDTQKTLVGVLMVLILPFMAKIYQRNATYKALSHLLSWPAICLFFIMPIAVEAYIENKTGASAYFTVVATYIVGSQIFGYFHKSLDTITRFSIAIYIFVFHGMWFRSLPLATFSQRLGWHLLVNSVLYLLTIICVASDEYENDTVDLEDFVASDNEQDLDQYSDDSSDAEYEAPFSSSSSSSSSSSDDNEWDFDNQEYSFNVQDDRSESDSESENENEKWPPVDVDMVERIVQSYASKYNMAPVLDRSTESHRSISVEYTNDAAVEELPEAGIDDDYIENEDVSMDSITIGGRINS